LNGPVLATIQISNTGGFTVFRPFGAVITPPVSQVKDLFFKFVGGGGFLFDIRIFSFQSISPGLKQSGSTFGAKNFDSESAPNSSPIVTTGDVVGSVMDGSWVIYDLFDFGTNELIGKPTGIEIKEKKMTFDGNGIYIRDGIIIVPTGATVPDGFTL